MGAAEISQDAVESVNLGQIMYRVIICHHSQQIGEVKIVYTETAERQLTDKADYIT